MRNPLAFMSDAAKGVSKVREKPTKTVVFVCDSATIDGGAERVALISALAASKSGMDVVFFAGGDRIDRILKAPNIKVVLTGSSHARTGSINFKKIADSVWNNKNARLFEETISGLDQVNSIIHLHSWSSALSASILGPLCSTRIPVVITAHEYGLACPNSCMFDFKKKTICNRCPGSLKCLLANCDRSAYPVKLFRDIRYLLQLEKMKRIHPTIVHISTFEKNRLLPYLRFEHRDEDLKNPIDIGTSCDGNRPPSSVHEVDRWNLLQKKGRVLLFVGRLEYEKGADIFCEAAARLGYPAVIVGDGRMREELESRYSDSIEFVGWVDSCGLRKVMESAEIFVMPSRWYEASPLVTPEAQLSAALPLVVSDECAAADDVEPGRNGLLFRTGDVDSLVSAILEVNDDYPVYKEGALLTREKVAESRSIASYSANLMKMYARVAGWKL